MKKRSHDFIRGISGLIVVVGLFILVAWYVQGHIELVQGYLDKGFLSVFVFVFISFLFAVIAPISEAPLIPIASGLWGWPLAAVYNLAGWAVGSLVAFLIAKKYGVKLVSKFASLNDIHKLGMLLPKKHMFWSILFLRLGVSYDIMSYVIGLFTRMPATQFMIASIIAAAPWIFLYAYLGTVPFYYQIITFGVAFIITSFIISHGIAKYKKMKKERK